MRCSHRIHFVHRLIKNTVEGNGGAAVPIGGAVPKGLVQKESVQRGSIQRIPNPGGARAFSIAEITGATRNFKHEIGRGGFGPVYYGKLPNGEFRVRNPGGWVGHPNIGLILYFPKPLFTMAYLISKLR